MWLWKLLWKFDESWRTVFKIESNVYYTRIYDCIYIYYIICYIWSCRKRTNWMVFMCPFLFPSINIVYDFHHVLLKMPMITIIMIIEYTLQTWGLSWFVLFCFDQHLQLTASRICWWSKTSQQGMIERTGNCRNLKLIRYYCNNSAQWTPLTHEEIWSFEACFHLVEYLLEGKLRSRVSSSFVPKDCQLHTTTPNGWMLKPFLWNTSTWRLELPANFISTLYSIYNTYCYRNMSYISTLYDTYTAVHPFLKQPILRMIDLMCVGLPTCWPILTINWPISHRSGMLDPTSRARLGTHMFARARSGGCFCSFYLCFHEVVPIWYISFFCDCFTDIWRILNDSNWTLLVISVGSDAPSLGTGTLFSQVIAAQMKTWFDVMHVYVLKPQPFQKHICI